MLTSVGEAQPARTPTPTRGAGAQSGQYEYEASYPRIDRPQRSFPRPLASLQ